LQLPDQLGGVHLEGLGELADGAGVGFVHAAGLELEDRGRAPALKVSALWADNLHILD
jgi:hypothetical protein